MTAEEQYLCDAVDFFRKVKASNRDDRMAVGEDHWNWLEEAACKLADMLTRKEHLDDFLERNVEALKMINKHPSGETR